MHPADDSIKKRIDLDGRSSVYIKALSKELAKVGYSRNHVMRARQGALWCPGMQINDCLLKLPVSRIMARCVEKLVLTRLSRFLVADQEGNRREVIRRTPEFESWAQMWNMVLHLLRDK